MSHAHAKGPGRTILVLALVVLFVAVIGWFFAQGVSLPVMAAITPIVFTAYVMMGAMLWFVISEDGPPA